MDKVISSSIRRSFNKNNDELYDLLKVVPAKPIVEEPVKQTTTCEFKPRKDKQYIPKKKIRHKVKTVKDIRDLYEKDVMSELPAELEKQQNYILRKIKGGSIKDENTKTVAKRMINCDKPLTKSLWQMLMNINPESHTHSTQYVLCNGRPIRVNGSKGGKSKFICKYDTGRSKSFNNNPEYKKKFTKKRKGSLLSSVLVNFKSGPLSRKKFLDNSYQKHHVGPIELINLPKPGLEIQPLYGSALDPTISCFVNKLRDENGTITQNWAEFAVSVLGTVNQTKVKQMYTGSPVTFDLNYNHDQKRLLMRRDLDNNIIEIKDDHTLFCNQRREQESDVVPEVKIMMERLIDAVEINLCQDDLCKEDDEVREECHTDQPTSCYKDKLKRRYCELDRLDVTVIRLNENDSSEAGNVTCKNSYCALGCICNSLQSSVVLKGHCGLIDCMFGCRCDFQKNAMIDAMDSGCSELLPGLFNLNNEINCSLSKEEQKFRQTVIVSGDKSILLKSNKRSCKSSKKYEDYYNSLDIKPKSKLKPILTLILPKLKCDNIEPWCMVHNLYKCFCKGRFTDISVDSSLADANKKVIEGINDPIIVDEAETEDYEKSRKEKDYIYQPRVRKEKPVSQDQPVYEIDSDDEIESCARVQNYERKFSNGYYFNANDRIRELEKNDLNLRKRLARLFLTSTGNVMHSAEQEQLAETEEDQNISVQEMDSSITVAPKPPVAMVDARASEKSEKPNKNTLKAWLENSYQQYKQRLDMGILKTTLEAPQKGKIALYPWEFILNRYSERKNYFLVSKQAPHRIFMAVNSNNPLFENCINIDDIRFADLHKYPIIVKNLLTNTNHSEEFFSILSGLNHCWEFIGTVTRSNEEKDNNVIKGITTNPEKGQQGTDKGTNLLVNLDAEASLKISTAIQEMSPTIEYPPKHSRWFIMTVENDFSEIQFYNRGFFVKYKSIVKAINVARVSGKTVRLSSKKCVDKKGNETQFGIYAIPNTNEYCVFIGPYEVNEPLGIETVKTVSLVGKSNRTRGVWITTDKVDNLKVIDNPLSYIPSQRSEYKDLIAVENNGSTNDNIKAEQDTKVKQSHTEISPTKDDVKVVKPIKISKSNGFYQLRSSDFIKTVSNLKPANQKLVATGKTFILKSSNTTSSTSQSVAPIVLPEFGGQPLMSMTCAGGATVNRVQNKPVAEVAPQIKIAAVYSEVDNEKTTPTKRREGGMVILKPEEINKRLIIDGNKSPKASSSNGGNGGDGQMDMDIEHFLGTSSICTPPVNETYVISDDDEDAASNTEVNDDKQIYMECTNIKNLGAIVGEQHKTKGVRFEFPGFHISDFYAPEEVFSKINQVMSRMIYIPDDLELEWQIVDSFDKLQTKRLLKKDAFGANLMLTKQGFKNKSGAVTMRPSKPVKTYLSKKRKVTKSEAVKKKGICDRDQIHASSIEYEEKAQLVKLENTDLDMANS